jgi:hypothetical protein
MESTTHPRKGKWIKPHKPSHHDKRGPRQDPVAVSEEEHVVAVRAPADKSNQETLMQEACDKEEERYETFRLRMMDTQRRKR